jgi:hypothetical protein
MATLAVVKYSMGSRQQCHFAIAVQRITLIKFTISSAFDIQKTNYYLNYWFNVTLQGHKNMVI